MFLIHFNLNILASHIQDYQIQSSTVMNLNPDLKAEISIKTHYFQKSKNHMNYFLPPPNPCGSHTITTSSDICITDKMTMNLTIFPQLMFIFQLRQ